MARAEPDVPAYMTFPKEHHAKLHSTNPIERLSGKIKCRVGALLLEQKHVWAVQRARYMTLETMAASNDNPMISLPVVAR